MLFPTKLRLDTALSRLISRLTTVQSRLAIVLSDIRAFDGILGPAVETEQLNCTGEQLTALLIGMRDGLRDDMITFREVNVRLSSASKMVSAHEQTVFLIQRARRAADITAETHFRSKNA